jgi:CelD/BcsL family acetyltransferase involved in cellulose biosynthesis
MFDQDILSLKDTAMLPDFPEKKNKYRIELIRSAAEFKALRTNWDNLFLRAKSKSIFLTWEWLFTWWCHFGNAKELALITVWNLTNQLVGIAPFYQQETGHFPRIKSLHFLGNNSVASDFMDFLIIKDDIPQIFEEIGRFLTEIDWDYLELNDLTTASGTFDFIIEWCQRNRFFYNKIHDEICPFIQLNQNYEAFLSGLGKRTRRNIRNFERRLEKDFRVKFNSWQEKISPSDLVKATFQLHALRQDNKKQYSPFLEPEIQSFHREAIDRLTQKSAIIFHFLTSDEKIVGILYLFDDQDKFYLYQGGYDPRFIPSSLNITQVMIAQTIKLAIEKGRKSYQLLRGQNDLKMSFSDQFLTNSTLIISRTPAGRLEILKRFVSQKCKLAMKRLMPLSWWERLKSLLLKKSK